MSPCYLSQQLWVEVIHVQCHNVTVLPCQMSLAMLQCSSVTMSVWVFKCHNVTMFQCHNSQMSQCIPVWAFVWKSCHAMAGFNNNSWTMNASVWGICLKWDIVGRCLKQSWGVFKVALVIELQRWGKMFRGNPISVLISVFNDILSKAPRMFRYSKYINSYILSNFKRLKSLLISYM